MKYLSERVSIDRQEGRTSVVISARLPRKQEALLIAWAIAWFFCGAYILYAHTQLASGDPVRQYLLVFLAFWSYFAVVVGKAVLWRLKGFELWRVKDGTLTIKDSLFGMGKARPYFVDNIQRLGLLNIDPRSWKWQLNQSGWMIGGLGRGNGGPRTRWRPLTLPPISACTTVMATWTSSFWRLRCVRTSACSASSEPRLWERSSQTSGVPSATS